MQTRIISGPEFVTEALFGIGLSFGLTSGIKSVAKFKGAPEYSRLMKVARGLAHKQGGHNKFLETIMFTLDIDAPRYWWSQFDTYRVGISKQSESTMHTIMAREITDDDFEGGMFEHITEELNAIRSDYLKAETEGDEEAKTRCFMDMKAALPEAFLQRRIVVVNLKTLQNMYMQRKNHRLPQWREFFEDIRRQLEECTPFEEESELALHCLFGIEEAK